MASSLRCLCSVASSTTTGWRRRRRSRPLACRCSRPRGHGDGADRRAPDREHGEHADSVAEEARVTASQYVATGPWLVAVSRTDNRGSRGSPASPIGTCSSWSRMTDRVDGGSSSTASSRGRGHGHANPSARFRPYSCSFLIAASDPITRIRSPASRRALGEGNCFP